jgi:hypothetical protein
MSILLVEELGLYYMYAVVQLWEGDSLVLSFDPNSGIPVVVVVARCRANL